MTTAVQHRRGTTAEHAAFTGLEGEVTIDTTKDTAVIHDGTLAGGYPLAKENLANVTTSGLSSIDGASTASDDKFFIFDQSATSLKTITRAELNNAIEQDALANVAITGGTINGTAIGGTTPAAGAFTTLSASGAATLNTLGSSGATLTGGSINGMTVGTTTAAAGAFTTLSATGAITSTLATGTAPLVIASTTKVANLNVDLLDGADWAAPAALGSTTPAAVSATTLSASSTLSVTGAGSIQGLTVGRGAGGIATNTAVGASALAATASGGSNTGIGYLALTALTSGSDNTSVGRSSLASNTTGSSNVGLGVQALQANTTASNNTAVGYQAGYSNTTGSVTAVGRLALYGNTTGADNVAMGASALETNSTGASNAAFGHNALVFNTTGSYNTAQGASALRNNTTSSNNTAVGYQAGYNNTTGVITAFGYQAGYSQTTADANTAIGLAAMYGTTTGSDNVALGQAALYENTTGGSNTAIGRSALRLNTTASNNTAVGYQAGYSQTTGTENVFVGQGAGYANTTGYGCTYVGRNAGSSTTGIYNNFFGYGAGNAITTGTKNTILGRYDGNYGGLDIRTSSNYIVLSDGDGNPRGIFDGSGNFRVGSTSTLISANEKVSIDGGSTNTLSLKTSGGASSWDIFAWNSATSGNNNFIEFGTETSYTTRGSIVYNRAGGVILYNTTSDYRAKDISGPVTNSGALIDSTPVYMGKMKGATQERPMFIAHETPSYAHTGVKDAVDADGNPIYQQMDASALIPVMWAEIQSLRKRLADAGL